MRDGIIILGAGGFAREAYCWAIQSGLKVYGFFQEVLDPRTPRIYDVPVFNDLELFQYAEFLTAVGDPKTRMRLHMKAVEHHLVPCYPIIHPKSVVGHNVFLERDTIICPGVVLTTDVRMGVGAIININATVGHDCLLGDFVTVSPGANVSGRCVLGARSYIGTNAALREGVRVEEEATVGMGAVCVKNVPRGTTVVGNPARALVEPQLQAVTSLPIGGIQNGT